MSIQNIRRAIILPLFQTGEIEEELKRFQQAYSQLAQQVQLLHNYFQTLQVAIANGLTNVAVTLPVRVASAAYIPLVAFTFNNGGYWITVPTATGFTLNWATASVGAQSARILVVTA